MHDTILKLPVATRDYLMNELLHTDRMGINITDAEANVLFINDAHFFVTGHRKSEYFRPDGTGRNMRDLIRNGIVTNSASLMVIESGKPVDIRQSSSAGKTYQIHALPVRDGDGKLLLILNILTDITEFVSLEEKYTRVAKRNDWLEKAIDRERENTFSSAVMRALIEQTKVVAKTDAPILVSGPAGSGKRGIVDLIHKNSPRKNEPFVSVNCTAIPGQLLEAELFGYAPGGFSGGISGGKAGAFEEAAGGTLLLDEIGGMPRMIQGRVLNILRTGRFARLGGAGELPVRFRLVSATNLNLKAECEKKNFLTDLYYEISTIELKVPALRDRREDIPLLVDEFLRQFNEKYGRKRAVELEAMRLFRKCDWNGNVRELRNVIERLVIQSEKPLITAGEAYAAMGMLDPSENGDAGEPFEVRPDASLHEMMEEYEKRILTECAKHYKTGTALAERLGTDQSTISRKLKKHGIRMKGE